MSHREGRLSGDQIFFRAWESGETPRANVVLSHGYGEHSGRYEHVAERLLKSDFAVWAIDHRGHGQSEGDRGDVGSWESVVADLDQLVDVATAANAGIPTVLVGHSLGGAIAIAYAIAHQDRLAGLSLSAPAIVLAPELLALAELPEIPPLPLADGVSSDPAVVAAYKADPLVYQGAPPANLLMLMGTAAALVEQLPQLTLPVQIMQGSADLLIPAQAFRVVVDGVGSLDISARLWPGLFHEIFNEPERDAVLDELVSWITSHS